MDLFSPKVAQSVVRSEKQWKLILDYDIPTHVVRWASNEVERQHEKASYVYNMIEAWFYAMSITENFNCYEHHNNPPNLMNILTLGYLVKPDLNVRGVRQYNVSVGWDQKLDWPQVPRALENLVSEDAFKSLSPEEWYREFEEIHPFGDGNGRVGSILLNWLRGTLSDPIYPPDVYDPDFFQKSFKGDDTFGDD